MPDIEVIAFWLFAVVALALAVALYRSGKNASTEALRYIYSPTHNPSTRTPKWAFAVLALAFAIACTYFGFADYVSSLNLAHILSPQLMPFLDALSHVCGLLTVAAVFASMLLLLVTSRPIPLESERTGDQQDETIR